MRHTQPDDLLAFADDAIVAPAGLRWRPGSDRRPPAVAATPPLAAGRPASSMDLLDSAGRIDLARLTAVPPLHRAIVAGGSASPAGTHIGGAMRPSAAGTVALSDGTHISFGAVEEIPALEYA